MAKKQPELVGISEEDPIARILCPTGGCIWIKSLEGWELFETCGDPDCHCSTVPPMLGMEGDPGKAIIMLCEESPGGVIIGSRITSIGYIAFKPGFSFDRRRFSDYCAAVSLGGSWRYGRRGANIGQSTETGHLDSVRIDRAVLRIDRLSADGTKIEELCGIGILEPTFGGDPAVEEELARYVKR